MALAVIFGYGSKGKEHMEVALMLDDAKEAKKWVDVAPVNAYAALLQKGGIDEALNANVMIAAHEATWRSMPPCFSSSPLSKAFQFLVLIPLWVVLGILGYQELGSSEGLAILWKPVVPSLFLQSIHTSTGTPNQAPRSTWHDAVWTPSQTIQAPCQTVKTSPLGPTFSSTASWFLLTALFWTRVPDGCLNVCPRNRTRRSEHVCVAEV